MPPISHCRCCRSPPRSLLAVLGLTPLWVGCHCPLFCYSAWGWCRWAQPSAWTPPTSPGLHHRAGCPPAWMPAPFHLGFNILQWGIAAALPALPHNPPLHRPHAVKPHTLSMTSPHRETVLTPGKLSRNIIGDCPAHKPSLDSGSDTAPDHHGFQAVRTPTLFARPHLNCSEGRREKENILPFTSDCFITPNCRFPRVPWTGRILTSYSLLILEPKWICVFQTF